MGILLIVAPPAVVVERNKSERKAYRQLSASLGYLYWLKNNSTSWLMRQTSFRVSFIRVWEVFSSLLFSPILGFVLAGGLLYYSFAA